MLERVTGIALQPLTLHSMIRRTLLKLLPGIAATLLGGSWLHAAELRLPAIFSDHMVLQSGQSAPVWGWATPGEEVTVTVAGQTQSTRTGAAGKWKVTLPPLEPSDKPQTLTVKGSNSPTATIQDVLVGEVWLASGQSNMAYLFSRGQYPPEESAAANRPTLRFFTVSKQSSREPKAECEGSWQCVLLKPWATSPPWRTSLPGICWTSSRHLWA
ncbi:hypothetical protein [Verrucomicrobium spinosum]|uniref:hypothetical protein n=1 Tax=Verrucomicrobium spinosum TaxID=2736 RepID=UPI0009465B5B|nr:hypothetical protein [Verrucomicrobium spinosum]